VMAHLRGAGTLMPPARVGRERRSVWDEEYVPDTVRDGPSASTRYNYSATGLPQRAVRCTLHANELHTFHEHAVQGLQPGDTHLCLQFSRWTLHMTADTRQSFVPCLVDCADNIYKKW
jgi:hypothetical protein